MIDNRVAELRLHVRTAAAGRIVGLGGGAEAFTRRVLERASELLDARAPGRIILLRHLLVRWRLREGTLALPDAATRFAEDICARLEREPPWPLVVPTGWEERDVAVFEDEARWRAAHLLARARGAHRAWFFAALEREEAAGLGVLLRPDNRRLAWEVLVCLAAGGTLTAVFGALPVGYLVSLVRVLGTAGARPAPSGSRAPPDVVERLLASTRALPRRLPGEVVELAVRAQARALLGPATGGSAIEGVVAEVLARAPPALDGEDAGVPLEGEARGAPEGSGDAAEDRAPEDLIAVRAGGLFYLLNCALELGVGEVLWRACLPEPVVFAHAAAALLGDELAGDPAPSLFAGASPDLPLPPMIPEQQAEVAAALLAALAAAMPRRRLATLPETVLVLVPAAGRMLVAAAAGSPFPLFAWPAPGSSELRTGVEVFLRAWPESAPAPRAAPPLAELDRRGRLRSIGEIGASPSLFLPRAGTPHAAALLAQIAGAMAYLLDARASADPSPTPAAYATRYLVAPARIRLGHEEMTVIFAADAVDLSLRRAGLDRDPGHVPWLRRSVRFAFGGLPADDFELDHRF